MRTDGSQGRPNRVQIELATGGHGSNRKYLEFYRGTCFPICLRLIQRVGGPGMPWARFDNVAARLVMLRTEKAVLVRIVE